MFRSAFKRGNTTYSEIGSPIADTYSYRIDKKTGKRILTKTGETNIYEMIQASHESTKIENIIKKVTGGDVTALQVKDGQYIDISEIPTNMIELQNTIFKATDEFNKLPAEIRANFDNSVEKYISMYGSNEWIDGMGLTPDLPKEEIKEEIKEEKLDE